MNGYLTKPTTRLARYPLLLEACLKHTPADSSDKIILPKVVKLVREFLNKVNIETGRSENRFNLAQLDQQLVFKNGETVVRCIHHTLWFSFCCDLATDPLSYDNDRTFDCATTNEKLFIKDLL